MVQQYLENHSVILGQKPATVGDVGFWIFRCPSCREIYEPRLTSGGLQDLARRGYDEFMDQMEKTSKKEPTGENM